MRATKLIESLQGTAAKGEARQPPSAVGDELAEAIAEAAMDEGDDVDTLGILEGGGAAALRAAEMVLDDAVESGDSVAIENAARLLARLAAGDATFQEAADAGEVRESAPKRCMCSSRNCSFPPCPCCDVSDMAFFALAFFLQHTAVAPHTCFLGPAEGC